MISGNIDTDWALLSSVGYQNCAIKTSGTLWCWGMALYGKLGYDWSAPPAISYHLSVPYIYSPTPVSMTSGFGANINWMDVSVGGSQTCAKSNSGNVKCWGMQSFGTLSTGPNAPAPDYESCTSEINMPGHAPWTHPCTAIPQTSSY